MPIREPDYGVLDFIRQGKPIAVQDLFDLWYRVQNYEALETIVDIAMREHMPLWAAEEDFKRSFLEWEAGELVRLFSSLSFFKNCQSDIN